MKVVASSYCDASQVSEEYCYSADYGKLACAKALKDANWKPEDVEMIIGFSISPSNISDDPNIVGPRIAHPIQRDLELNSAFVFDLMDCDWGFALDVANGFMEELDLDKVMIVRGEYCEDTIQYEEQETLIFTNGAGVLLLERSETPSFSIEYINPDHSVNAATMNFLNAYEQDVEKLKFNHSFDDAFIDESKKVIKDSIEKNYKEDRIGGVFCENLLGKKIIEDNIFDVPVIEVQGQKYPFDLVASLESYKEQKGTTKKIIGLTFNPFKPIWSKFTLEI